jgi:hypothetical protein
LPISWAAIARCTANAAAFSVAARAAAHFGDVYGREMLRSAAETLLP